MKHPENGPIQARLHRLEWLEQRTLLSLGGPGDEPGSSPWSAEVGSDWLHGGGSGLWVDFQSAGDTAENPPAVDPCSLTYTAEGVSGRLSTPGAVLEKVSAAGREFTRLAVPGWGRTSEIGRAELPVLRTSLIIPDGVELLAEHTVGSSVSLGSGHLVYPVQPPSPDSMGAIAMDGAGDGRAPGFAYDADYYSGVATPETDVLAVGDPAIARGTSVVLVGISPFQYDPVTGEITVATELTFSLEFVRSGASDGGSDAPPAGAQSAKTDVVAAAADADYLIVTADAFYEEVQPLADWKRLKGFRTYVARLSEIGNSSRAVRDFISEVYHTGTRTSYVLLVGDYSDVPSNYVTGYFISDQPYACVDGGDYLPDLAIGRLPVHTESETTTVVDKILTYDRTPDLGDWYDDVLMASYFQDRDDEADGIADRFFLETSMHVHDYLRDHQGMTMHTALTADTDGGPPYYYRARDPYPHRISVSGDPPYPVPQDVVDLWTGSDQATLDITSAIEEGVGLVQHRDHGSETAWGEPPFSVSDVNELSNGVKTPVVFSLNCETGTFDFYGGDCLAEAFLKHPDGGAVGVLAATLTSYSGWNDLLAHGTYTGFWPDYDPTHADNPYPHSMRPAEAVNFGKFYMLCYQGANPYSELEFNEYHWFGDPEMMLRTDTPAMLSVAHPQAIRVETPTDISVTVTDAGGPVAGARVCISLAGTDDYWVGITDSGGGVTFADLATTQIGNYDVVVSSHNTEPYEGTIISVTRGPFASLHTPPAGSATNVDLGYVDVEWLDFFDVGLDTTTVDSQDVGIAGTSVTATEHRGGNVWRYFYSGSLTPGMVNVVVHADQVKDQDGDWNVGTVLQFVYDVDSPSGSLHSPINEGEVYVDLGYVDILLSDVGEAGVDFSSLDAGDVTITGVTITEAPTDLGGGVWRYRYTGDLPTGVVTVDFLAGEVLDRAGNPNAGHTETFTFSPLEITNPATLPRAAYAEPYSVSLQVRGGVGPYDWSLPLPLVITECGLGGPDYIEIQNTSEETITTAGWVLAVSNDYTDINGVNPTYWRLPTSISGGGILYRTDDTQNNYFGGNILWNKGDAGWAVIIDETGRVVDFLAWHWTGTNIGSFDAQINGHNITVGDEFSGEGVIARGTGSIQRVGNADHNNASDFQWLSPESMGTQNEGLLVPFLGGGTMPEGLALDRATGVISGAPLETGSFDFAAMVMDSHLQTNIATKLFHLEVVVLPPLRIEVPDLATEGAGAAQGIVGIPDALATDLTVSLQSDDTSEASVPETVVIPAGRTEVTFQITIVDDSELDWYQEATIVASAAEYATRCDTITIADNETATLTVDLPGSATEGDGLLGGQGTVTASAAPTADVPVELSCDDTTEVTVPATVTLPAGQTSVSFDLTIVDDAEIDRVQRPTITARVESWTEGSASLEVIDNDNGLVVEMPPAAWEGDGVLPGAAVVSISATLPADVVVSLVSADTSELNVPPTVTIPAGSTVALFDLAVIDDADYDGVQPAMVTASAAGFNDGSGTIQVADDDVHHLAFDEIHSPQTAGEPVSTTLWARDVDDATILVFGGTVGLGAAGAGGPVTLEPQTTGPFVGGAWSGELTVHAVDENVVLTADDGSGHTGRSNPFDVVPGELDRFEFGTVISPQYVDIPFRATLTAVDVHGYTVTDFGGSVDLSGLADFGATVIAIAPTVTAPLVDGVWTGIVTILEELEEADDVFLRAEDGQGHAGDSNRFNVRTAPPLWVDVPAEAAEGDGTVQGTLRVQSTLAADLAVNLSSSDTSEATVPETATILAGQTEAMFPITILDDAELDWLQQVTITATAEGHARGSGTITVADNETATLTVDLPQSAREGDGLLVGQGTVTASEAPTSAVTVQLSSSDTSELTVPATVRIPAGHTFATFNVTLVDDTQIDGTRSVTVTARVANWTDGSRTMDVLDNEGLDLVLTLPGHAWEGVGVLVDAAAVGISGTLPSDLVVSLASDDASELQVPTTVTIPAGDTSVQFDLTVVDDADNDGLQAAGVTAAAAGFHDGAGSMNVADDDVHHFAFNGIGTPQGVKEPFLVTIRAENVDDETIPATVAAVGLSGGGDGGPAVISPAATGTLIDGTWSGTVTVDTPDTNVVLSADDGQGHAGASNPFDVAPGAMDHLRWGTIATPQYVGIPFTATLTAIDVYGFVATGFQGTAELGGTVTAETTSTVVITECDLGSPDFIEIQNVCGREVDTSGWVVAVSDSYSDINQVNAVCWFLPPSMPAGEIRYQTDDQDDNYWGQNVLWNEGNAGWAVILDDAGCIVDAVVWDWATFRIHGMDVVINGHHVTIGEEFTGGGLPASGPGTIQRSGNQDHNALSDFAWLSPSSKGVENAALTVPFIGGVASIDIHPAVTAAFSGGVWSGELTVLEEAVNLCLHAESGNGRVADGNTFDVETAPPLTVNVLPEAAEGDGPLQGTVGIPFALAADLPVDLRSSDASEATVPDAVTIPAGAVQTSFEITILDDSELDWFQNVTITASTTGYLDGCATIAVEDDEMAILTVRLPWDAAEGDGLLVGLGTIWTDRAATSDVIVELHCDDTTEAIVPATVTIPAGQTTIPFDLTTVDDTEIDDTQGATVTGRVKNWVFGTDTIHILDNESLDLVVTLPADVWEGDGVLADAAAVSISGTLPADLVVSLASPDADKVQVPATATIPAGQTSATFDLTIVDDADCDGVQTATVVAGTAGFVDGSRWMEIADDDVHHFTWDAIGTPQTASEPFGVTIRAKNVDHRTIPAYAGTLGLSGAGAGGTEAVDPATTGALVEGRWTGNLTVHAVDGSVVLRADDGLGHTGASNAFDVVPGPLDHFGFSTVASPRYVGLPFPVVITAVDAHGYTVPEFDGPVELSGWVGTGKAPTVMITECDLGNTDFVEIQNVSGETIDTSGWVVAVSNTYLDINRANPTYWHLPPSMAAGEVRYKTDDEQDNYWGGNILWSPQSNGWAIIVDDAGEVVDFVAWQWTAAEILGMAARINGHDVTIGEEFDGDGLVSTGWGTIQRRGNEDHNTAADFSWVAPASKGSQNTALTTPFTGGPVPIAITPTASSAFLDGVWSGELTVREEAVDMYLRADDGNEHLSDSNTFDVVLPAEIVGRHVFYNHSGFDGNDPNSNALDDGAVAPDKQALLPGQAATFANYTSYDRGINGIMIDVHALAGTPADEDFEFRVGNDNHPQAWSTAAAPQSISVRRGAGADGSDRVTIIWDDHAVSKQWLQVTVRATAHTGLAEKDVFYFGNAAGETGNSTSDTKVNAYDMLGARDNQRDFKNPAPIDFPFDFNRDARVDAYDMLIARDNQTHFLNALRLIDPSAGKRGDPTPPTADGDQGGEVAGLEDRAAATDFVLERGSGSPDAMAAGRMAWLGQFDQSYERSQPAGGRNSAKMAADEAVCRFFPEATSP